VLKLRFGITSRVVAELAVRILMLLTGRVVRNGSVALLTSRAIRTRFVMLLCFVLRSVAFGNVLFQRVVTSVIPLCLLTLFSTSHAAFCWRHCTLMFVISVVLAIVVIVSTISSSSLMMSMVLIAVIVPLSSFSIAVLIIHRNT